MSFDPYTKGVVTVIAAALCALVVQNAIQQSKAENGPLQKVQICDDQHCLTKSDRQVLLGQGLFFDIWPTHPF